MLKMPKQPISARIEKNILKDSKAVAKLENRSFNNLLETALITYCKGKCNRSKAERVSSDGVFFRCDNCGHEPQMKSDTDDLLQMHYCPNCGSEFE